VRGATALSSPSGPHAPKKGRSLLEIQYQQILPPKKEEEEEEKKHGQL